jgi:hypothetical protein
MAAHGEKPWPPVGRFSGRLWGDLHGRRHTFVLDQTYTLDGQQQTISAPTSIVFRRRGSDWNIVLIHTVPLPEGT